jgi:hypothetical protein
LILDTKGINVWCAAGKGTFGTDELVGRILKTGLSEIVSHRKLVLPQLGAPGVSAHEVTKQTGFSVVYGPVRAKDIKAFLDSGFQSHTRNAYREIYDVGQIGSHSSGAGGCRKVFIDGFWRIVSPKPVRCKTFRACGFHCLYGCCGNGNCHNAFASSRDSRQGLRMEGLAAGAVMDVGIYLV